MTNITLQLKNVFLTLFVCQKDIICRLILLASDYSVFMDSLTHFILRHLEFSRIQQVDGKLLVHKIFFFGD